LRNSISASVNGNSPAIKLRQKRHLFEYVRPESVGLRPIPAFFNAGRKYL
jgi:hypothetical protein